jgi:NADH-quinone oxidoreductase subunit G
MNHRKLYNDKDELDSSLLNQINLYIEKNNSTKSNNVEDIEFNKEVLKINNEDYYDKDIDIIKDDIKNNLISWVNE